ncbi:hypothetical protein [Flavihumibacter fluvii]|uniref:hypothetical protein n=1 Tax=Flavihumibacter fluvii TaxID=2838157 RepID=UPI001BDF3BB7|nr:hypothetical protein [Flavihumibacter fluvii]ULQ53189.1 hypothetical protein KJS93_02505 [Flavihumibacter fluvii]
MNEKFFADLDEFSLTKSGLFHKLQLRLGIANTFKYGNAKRAIVLAGFTWLPLLILSGIQGLAFGDQVQVPFWKDFTNHARFLIVLPMLVYAESSFDFRLKEATKQLFRSAILTEKELPAFGVIKNRVIRLSGSILVTLLILGIIGTNIPLRLHAAKINNLSIWMFSPGDNSTGLSFAGIYLSLVSMPLLQFFILQWMWRWMTWFHYFRKLSRLPLRLNPAHPDLAGGIGFLGFQPGPFLLVNSAISILFSAIIAERIVFLDEKLSAYSLIIAGFMFFSVLINILPLLLFIKPLFRHRQRGIFEYSALVQEHHRQFDDKWLGKPIKEQIRGFPDASSLTDFNTTFDTVNNMRLIPINLKTMITIVFIAVFPMLPLLAFEYSLVDLMFKVVQMLF